MDIFSAINRLNEKWPAAGRKLMGAVVPRIIPMTAGLGLRVVQADDRQVRMRAPLKKRSRNHVGSIYFGVLATLAEITMGLHLFRRYPPGPYGMLVKRAEFDFLAKAKTDATATCAAGEELYGELDASLARTGKAEGWVEVPVTGAAGEPYVRARFLIALKDFKSS